MREGKGIDELMSDQDIDTEIDLTLVDEVEQVVRKTAYMICDEQPDVPQPESLRDLDSFSMVQVLLELENITDMKLLERLDTFQGEHFRDLADYIVGLARNDDRDQVTNHDEDEDRGKGEATAAASSEQPTAA
jgi:hypothetical protein